MRRGARRRGVQSLPQFDETGPPAAHIVCRCGQVDPGRVHLTWECPFRTTQNLRDPVTGVERELLLPLVPRYPAAERRVLGHLMQPIVMELRRVQAAQPGVTSFSEQTVPEVNQLVRDLQATTKSLKSITEKVNRGGAGSLISSQPLPDYKGK